MLPGPGPNNLVKTTVVTVPYLTNTTDLREGDILTMRVPDPPVREKKAPRKATWDSQALAKANRDKMESRKKQRLEGIDAGPGMGALTEDDFVTFV